MPLMLYPHTEDTSNGTMNERIDQLMEAAERFKAAVLETTKSSAVEIKPTAPKDIPIAFNWEIIAVVLREVRQHPEGTKIDRDKKANYLNRLAEVYEVLRAARMSKLEAVRLALTAEANQLRGGESSAAAPTQVA